MIDDDADPETLDAWYRRTPDEIARAKNDAWNAAWAALRTPDDQAYETYDNSPFTGDATQPAQTAPTGDAVDAAAKVPPAKTAWANQDLGFLDVLSSGEAPAYNIMATTPHHPLRHIPLGPDGQTDYSQHPNSLIKYPDSSGHTVKTTAAGRYQINKPTWDSVVQAHPDLIDFTPLNQDKGAWYIAEDAYRTARGRDLSSDLVDEKNWPLIAAALKSKWVSLPGGGPGAMSQQEFNQRLRAAISRYRDPYPDN